MTKVKFDNYEFTTFAKLEDPQDFLENNIDYYSMQWAEANPEKAYMVNDWDFSLVYEDIDIADVAEDQIEVYAELLRLNYNL